MDTITHKEIRRMETRNIFIREQFVNATEGHMIGDSGVYETFTGDRGDLYRHLQREYGRCTGKVYAETPQGDKAVGWVFIGRDRYEDTGETYLREAWVTLHDAPPTVSTEYHYA